MSVAYRFNDQMISWLVGCNWRFSAVQKFHFYFKKLHAFLSPLIIMHSFFLIIELFMYTDKTNLSVYIQDYEKNWSRPTQPDQLIWLSC